MIRLSIWENIFLMNFTLLPYQHYVAMLLHNSCRLSVHRVPTNCKSGGQTTTMERRRHWHGQRHKCPDACAFLSRVSQECISPHVQRSPKCSPKRTHKNCRPDSWRRRITRDLFSLYICTYVYSLAYTRDTYIFVYNFFALFFAHFAHSSLHCLKLHFILYLETWSHFLVGNLPHKANIPKMREKNTVDFIFDTRFSS